MLNSAELNLACSLAIFYDLLAFLGGELALISAVKELAVEQLDTDNGKDELEEARIPKH